MGLNLWVCDCSVMQQTRITAMLVKELPLVEMEIC